MSWYNAARVQQEGSVILTRWRAQRQSEPHHPTRIRRGIDTSVNGSSMDASSMPALSMNELASFISSGAGQRGPVVCEHTAMTVSAVYACVALIAGAIATLPLPIYQRTAEGRARVNHDYWWLLNESPCPDMSAATFWEYLISACLFYGDGFAELLRPALTSNRVIGMRVHHPNRVTPFRAAGSGRLLYRVQPAPDGGGSGGSGGIGQAYTLDAADILHIPGLGFDGLRSCSPILHAARQAIGTALAAGEYSGSFFSNGAKPDFALKVPGKLAKDQADILRASWLSTHGGIGKSHMPAILSGGMEIEQLTMTNEDSQLLATRAFQIEEIARIFGVPPHMIGQTDKVSSWGSGVENMGRGFVKFTLQRHLVKIEQELNRKLWPAREKYFVEFNVAGLERGDLKSENEALRVALGRAGEPGWMTQNEVRRIKNMPPIAGGDGLLNASGTAATTNADMNPTLTGNQA